MIFQDVETIKNILFPTDFTEDAEKAFQYALETAFKTGAHLHLLHAVEEPYDFAVRVEETVEILSEEADEELNRLINEAKKSENYQSLSIDYQIVRGKPYGAIMNSAGELDIDLIIMGTKGESSLKRILYGNVTSDVILDSLIPVLTVPVNSKKPYLDRFIFATDFRSCDLESLQATVAFARSFDAEIHVLHVSEQKNLDSEIRFRGFQDYVRDTIDYEKIFFKHLFAERFSKGVAEYVRETPISLIIITRYKKAFLRTMLWAKNTQELTYHTTVPMLVLIPESL